MIEPFRSPDPLGNIYENYGKIAAHIQENRLLELAGVIWPLTSVVDRWAMLEHLSAQVRADEPPFCRFQQLRDVLDAYGNEEEFLDLVSTSRVLGEEISPVLYTYIALYVDTSQGREHAQFSTRAFYARYLEAHNGSPAE